MANNRSEIAVENVQAPEASLGIAIYPDKESWKNERGNRYSPEELYAMDRNWEVRITNPDVPRCCSAD